MQLTSFVAGENVAFALDLPNYRAANGWAVTYYLRGASHVDVAGVDTNGTYNFALTPAQSLALAPGVYYYQAFAAKSTTDKVLVDSGQIEITQSLVGVTTAYDGRSVNEQTLEAITLALKGVGTDAVQRYMVQTPHGSREIHNFTLAELMNLHKYFGGLVAAERRAKAGQSAISFEFFGFGS
jgi:hypothetical protein